jgi:hypothetical protein
MERGNKTQCHSVPAPRLILSRFGAFLCMGSQIACVLLPGPKKPQNKLPKKCFFCFFLETELVVKHHCVLRTINPPPGPLARCCDCIDGAAPPNLLRSGPTDIYNGSPAVFVPSWTCVRVRWCDDHVCVSFAR